jgi:hypothetical protein
MKLQMRSVLSFQAILFSLCFAGCSNSTDQPEVAEVSGVVTLDGKPVVGVNVLFQPDSGRAAVGLTNDQGEYELQYLYGVSGCKLGPNTVGFDWPPDTPNVVAIPAKHTGANAFRFEVKPGGNVFDITLTTR